MPTKKTPKEPQSEAFSCFLSIETEAMNMRGLLAGADALLENDQDRNHIQVLVGIAQDTINEIWELTKQMHDLYGKMLKQQKEQPPVSA